MNLNRYCKRASQSGQPEDFLDWWRAGHGGDLPAERSLRVAEIGAHDGVEFSNTFDLAPYTEKVMLVEPNRRSFAALKLARPDAVALEVAVVATDATTERFIPTSPPTAHYKVVTGTGALAGRISSELGMTNVGTPGVVPPDELENGYIVDCARLEPLLRATFGPDDVHFVSLDIEGSENAVLRRFFADSTPMTPRVLFWCVEYDHGMGEKRKMQDYMELESIMTANGYIPVGESPCDLYYAYES